MAYESFYFANGSIISDIKELRDILMSAEGKHFEHHVNDYKNDFATWIQYSLLNPSLAEKLRKTKDVYETIRILDESLGVEKQEDDDEVADEEAEQETQEDSSPDEVWQENVSDANNVNDASEKKEIEKEVEDLMSETRKVSEQVDNSHDGKKKDEPVHKFSVRNHRFNEFRALLLGTAFGLLVGMIVMYILIMNGVF